MHGRIGEERAFSSCQMGRRFLDHYANAGFEEIPGSPLLHESVPMSFVMSAGLAQVEASAMLLGGRNEKCYTLIQNCFRYFDMENVGKSDIHLSLFQMPGAFTFDRVSKKDEIAKIWDLLTKVYCLPASSLWVTFFDGGQVAGHVFASDRETRQAWKEVGVCPNHVVGLGADHNFWKQGPSVVGQEQAPKCGPNTEVFFDRGSHRSCGPSCGPGCDCGRFVEFLNTLFITMHIDDRQDAVTQLEDPFVETVIGLERAAMLLQQATSVYDIDSVRPLVEYVRRFVGPVSIAPGDRVIHERVLVDHVRALLFLKADGAPSPGKGGRRRLMRKLVREMLTSQKILNIKERSFVPSLAAFALDLYARHHPRLSSGWEKLLEDLADERVRFECTLQEGLSQLDLLLEQRKSDYLDGQEMLDMEKEHGVPEPLLESVLMEKQVRFSRRDYRVAYRRWYRDTIAGTN